MKHIIGKTMLLGATLLSCFAPSEHAYNGPTPALTLAVSQVPDFLFGKATYATPVKFSTGGCDTATISSIVATFHYDRGSQSKTLDISSRFVAGDGPAQNNGSTNTYTCYVPASFYSNVLVSGASGGEIYKDSQARYSVQVTFTPTTGGLTGSPVTLTSAAATGTVAVSFIDDRIDCVELPSNTSVKNHTISLTSPTQTALAKNGVEQFDEFQRGGAPFPEVQVSPPPGGFHIVGSDEAIATCNVTGSTLQAKTRLYDDVDWNAGTLTGWGAHARAYGLQRGGYFYVSYGGKTVTPLGSEIVMDMQRHTGDFDMDLFQAQYSVNLVTVNSGGLNLAGVAAGSLGIGWALAPAGAWAAVFGTASSIFGIIASVDFDGATYADRADGYASYLESHVTKDTPTGSGVSHNAFAPPSGSAAVAADFKRWGVVCHAGDQWAFAVNLQSSVTAISRPPRPFGGSVDCTSDIRYVVTSVQDLENMEVGTR